MTGAPGQVQVVDVALIRFGGSSYDPLPANTPAVLTFTPEPAAGLLVLLAVWRFPLGRFQTHTGVST